MLKSINVSILNPNITSTLRSFGAVGTDGVTRVTGATIELGD